MIPEAFFLLRYEMQWRYFLMTEKSDADAEKSWSGYVKPTIAHYFTWVTLMEDHALPENVQIVNVA